MAGTDPDGRSAAVFDAMTKKPFIVVVTRTTSYRVMADADADTDQVVQAYLEGEFDAIDENTQDISVEPDYGE